MRSMFEVKCKFEISGNALPCLEPVLWCHSTLVSKEGVYVPSKLNDFLSEKNL